MDQMVWSEPQVMPAVPGWYVVVYDSGADDLYHEPIIAWCIRPWRWRNEETQNVDVSPVTIEGAYSGDGLIVKRPDGSFDVVDGPWMENEAEALAYLRERERKEAANAKPAA